MKQAKWYLKSILTCAVLLSCGGTQGPATCTNSTGQLQKDVCVDNHTLAIESLDDKLHSCVVWGEYTYIDPSKLSIRKLFVCDEWRQ